MSYTKGKWFVEESYSIDAIAMLGKFNVQREVGARRAGSYDDAKRIVDCVNACDGMDDPLLEIARLRASVSELTRHLTACANELTFMIDEHNEQNMEDGSWKYDHQTPWEALHLIYGMGVK